MAEASVYANYKGSKGIKSGGVWQDGAFTNEDWRPTWRRFNGLVRQAKPMYSNYFSSDEATAMKQMKAFIKANLTGLKRGPDNNYVDNIKNIDELYAILGQASHDSYNTASKTQDGYDEPHSAFTEPLKRALGEFSNFLDLTNQLEAKGLNTKQINQFLSSLYKEQGKDSSTLAELANNIDGFSASEIANYGVQNDPDDPESYQMTDADVAVGQADTPTETVNQQITEAVVGDSSLDALRKEEGFREENGSYFVGDQEYAYDEENDQVVFVGGENNGERWTPEGSGMADQYDTLTEQEQQTIAQQQGIVDQLVGTDEVDPVTGEKVTPGLVNEYGDFVDQTLTDIDAPENDFAGQINAQLNQFLTGKDAEGNDILDDEGNPIKGFLDYQSDLEGAAETYKTDMQGLQGLYDQAYGDYEGELRPLRDEMGGVRDKLGGVADAQLDVAKDAGSTDYYTRLSDLLYEQSRDEVNRGARGAQETLNTMYANAGLDPSSPAFTAAMTDLAQSRSDALVASRRQAILDSYGLGSDMLSNRSNALSGAGSALNSQMSAIGSEMNALDSLYGVKLEGLNTRRDMIGQIYGADKDIAATGISGLNTVLNTNLQGINANQNQFNTKVNLSNDLYKNKAGMYGTAFDALGGMRGIYDKEGEDRFNTLTEFDQGTKSDAFILESLQQQASQNPNYEVPQWIIDIYGGNK